MREYIAQGLCVCVCVCVLGALSSLLKKVHTYLRCRARVGVDTAEVVETDHDQKVVAIENVESKHDGVLRLPEVGHHIDVHGTDHHCDAS